MSSEDQIRKIKWNKIKTSVVELALVSTSHGIPCIFRTKRVFLKLMWLVFFILCTAYGLCFLISAVLNYLNYDVVVKIQIVNEIPTEFPTLTFFFNDSSNYTLKQRFLSCYFNNKKCDLNDFEILSTPNNPIYFKFNSGKNSTGNKIGQKTSKLANKVNGFTAEIFLGLPNEYNTDNMGFSFYIHNYTSNPIETSEDPIGLAPGFDFSIKVGRVFSNKKGEPYSSCKEKLDNPNDFNSDLFKHMTTNSEYKYTQTNCYDLCLSKYLIDSCNSSLKLDYSWIILNFSNVCFVNQLNRFFESNVHEYCGPSCPLECNSINYLFQQTFTQYPSINYAKKLIAKPELRSLYPDNYSITYQDLRQSLLTINIFYQDLSYTSITEEAKTQPVDLVSNIGGLLGLFIGVSFLSFGELFEIFFEILFILFEKSSKIQAN